SSDLERGNEVMRASVFQAQFPGDAIESTGQPEAQGVGIFAHLGGNLRPGTARAAEVGEPALFPGEVAADRLQQLPVGGELARRRSGVGNLGGVRVLPAA